MKLKWLPFLLMLFPLKGYSKNYCVECHLNLEEEALKKPAVEWKESVHYHVNVDCVSCHGGNANVKDESAMDEQYGFKGVPARTEIPELCGGCHSDPERMKPYNLRTDQLREYKTSMHGKLLYEKGDQKVAVCTDCHGKHEIRKKDDPLASVYRRNIPLTCKKCHADADYMKEYGIPVNQFEKYSKSVHGRILFGEIQGKNPMLAPTCADCHGIHGATPPGVEVISEVCGNCHGVVADYYKESPHFNAMKEKGVPRCIDCHDYHGIQFPTLSMFDVNKGVCVNCHEKDSKELKLADTFKTGLSTMNTRFKDIGAKLEEVRASGRYIEDILLEFSKAKNLLVKAHSLTHTLNWEKVSSNLVKADAGIETVRKKIEKIEEGVKFRKKFAIYVDFLILFIVVMLLLTRWFLKKTELLEKEGHS